MSLEDIMKCNSFVVVGDTLNEEKYAYKIKTELLANSYKVYCVGKELESINDVDGDFDVLVLCIHPAKGIKLLKECKVELKRVLIQPGAESDEILSFLDENKIPYLQGCALVGLRLYKK